VSNNDVIDARFGSWGGGAGNSSIICPEIMYNDNSSKVCIFSGGSCWSVGCQICDRVKSIFSLQCD